MASRLPIPVTDDIVKAAKTEAGYKVTETIYKNGAYGWGLADYSETPEAAYAALAEYLKNGITFTQTISAKENTWAADAKSHTMTFDINTADGTFTVKVDGKNESTITFTNTFTYKTVSPGGGGSTAATAAAATVAARPPTPPRTMARRWSPARPSTLVLLCTLACPSCL